jgi:hypothetical protein
MQPLDLIQLQIRLEYQLDQHGWLMPIPGSTEQALYIVYRHTQGYVPYYSHQLSPNVRKRLMTFDPKVAFDQSGSVNELIVNFIYPAAEEMRSFGRDISPTHIGRRISEWSSE